MPEAVEHDDEHPQNVVSPPGDQDPPRLAETIWHVWPWASWCLPLAVVFAPSLSGGGWFAAIIFVLSPVIVPAAGLLGSLPRFLLRRAGHRSAPVEVLWLLLLHWWSWVPVMVTFQDETDMGRVPSLLTKILPVGLSHAGEDAFRTLGFISLVLTWIAIVFRVKSGSPFAGRTHWITMARVTGIAAPIVLVVGIVLAAVASAFQQDAAGERPAEVADLSSGEQRERYESLYTEFQESITPVREAMSPGGWDVSVRRRHFEGETSSSGFDSYSFEMRYTLDVTMDETELDQFARVLKDSGWEPTSSQASINTVYEHQEGARLRFVTWPESTSIDVTSPTWWGDEETLWDALEEDQEPRTLEDTEEHEDEQAEEDAGYDFDEWPDAP